MRPRYISMDQLITEVISQFGALGVLIVLGVYLVYHVMKESKNSKEENCMKENSAKLDIVLENQKILAQRVETVESRLDARIDSLISMVSAQPSATVQEIKIKAQEDIMKAPQNMQNQIKIAPRIHKVIRTYKDLINCDHIFYASFHNGTKSITGMPYYKFDIISERFSPDIENDGEFAPLYQNVDITRHDKLPQIIMQEGCVYCSIDDEGNSPMEEWDYIMYCRMIGRGIRQVAVVLLRDNELNPIGFVGAIKYDMDQMDVEELKKCTEELKQIYVTAPC